MGAVNGSAERGWHDGSPSAQGIGSGAIARHCAPASTSVAMAAPVALSAQSGGHSKHRARPSLQRLTCGTEKKKSHQEGKMATIQKVSDRL
jgi:hypothetical protein